MGDPFWNWPCRSDGTLRYDSDASSQEVGAGFDNPYNVFTNTATPTAYVNGTSKRPVFFEMTVRNPGDIFIGFCVDSIHCGPTGFSEKTVGFRSRNGKLYLGSSHGIKYGPPFMNEGDTIGVMLMFNPCRVMYFHNGRALPTMLLEPNIFEGANLSHIFGAVGFLTRHSCVEVNNGNKPFAHRPQTDGNTESLSECLIRTLDNPAYFPDVRFFFPKDGVSIFAHKALLSARSLTFNLMLGGTGLSSEQLAGLAKSGHWRKTTEGTIDTFIVESESAVFRKLLEFLYGGHVKLNSRLEARMLLELASHYSVDALIFGCMKANQHDYARPRCDLFKMVKEMGSIRYSSSFEIYKIFTGLKKLHFKSYDEMIKEQYKIDGVIQNSVSTSSFMGTVRKCSEEHAPNNRCPYDIYEGFEHFASEIQQIAVKPLYPDLTFIISDTPSPANAAVPEDKIVPAHRFFYATLSKYFQKVLQSTFLPPAQESDKMQQITDDSASLFSPTTPTTPSSFRPATPTSASSFVPEPEPEPEPVKKQPLSLDDPNLDAQLDALSEELRENPISGVRNAALWDTMLQNLTELGFSRNQSAAALLAYDMDSDHAAEVLFQNPDRHTSNLRTLIRRWRLRACPSLANPVPPKPAPAPKPVQTVTKAPAPAPMDEKTLAMIAKRKEKDLKSMGFVIPLLSLPAYLQCSCCKSLLRRSSALRSAICPHVFCQDCLLRKLCKVILKLHALPSQTQHPLPESIFNNIVITCAAHGCHRRIPLIAALKALKLDGLHVDAGCIDFMNECTRMRMEEVQRRREKNPVNVIIPVRGLSGDTLVMYNNWLYSNHDGHRVEELLTAHVLNNVARPDKQLFPVAQMFQDEALQTYCMSYMCQQSSISPTNIHDIYHSAIKFDQPRMKKACEDYIDANLIEFEHPRALQAMERWSDELITFFANKLDYTVRATSNYWKSKTFGKYCLIVTGCKHKVFTSRLLPTISEIASNMLSSPPPLTGEFVTELLRILVAFAGQRSLNEARLVWIRGMKLLTQVLTPLDDSVAALRKEVSMPAWEEFILRLKENFAGSDAFANSTSETYSACPACGSAFGVFKPRTECPFCKRSFCKKCLVPAQGELPRSLQASAGSDKKVCPYCNSILALLLSS